MNKEIKSTYEILSKIDCSVHVEKKGKFNYLSWAWAVDALLREFPDATWDVKRFGTTYDNLPYMASECGVFVEVGVTVRGIERSQIHPVLNHQNKHISKPNSFDINTSIQRCLVKAIALHGLGLYIYAGEDLPQQEDKQDQLKQIIEENKESILSIKHGISENTLSTAAESWFELDNETKSELWVAPSKGGPFTTKEREVMQSKAFREAYHGSLDDERR